MAKALGREGRRQWRLPSQRLWGLKRGEGSAPFGGMLAKRRSNNAGMVKCARPARGFQACAENKPCGRVKLTSPPSWGKAPYLRAPPAMWRSTGGPETLAVLSSGDLEAELSAKAVLAAPSRALFGAPGAELGGSRPPHQCARAQLNAVFTSWCPKWP